MKNPVVGLIEGGGTGPEVGAAFKRTVRTIYGKHDGGEVAFDSFVERVGYYPHTYWSLKKKFATKTYKVLRAAVLEEATDLRKYYSWARQHTLGVFRTAINAETLYYLRRYTTKVKVVPLTLQLGGKERRILFIRDQIQGYYANESVLGDAKKGSITVRAKFTQKNFNVLARFAGDAAGRFKMRNPEYLYIYKFHLFGLELQRMIDKAMLTAKVRGKHEIVQPDTGLHKLLGELKKQPAGKSLVVVTSNEVGDVLLEALLHYYRLATKESFYTLNVALFHAVDHAFSHEGKVLEVLQTMHGSADPIAGKGLLNPIATLRAAGYCLENWLHVPAAVSRLERAIAAAVKHRAVTRDMGGSKSTDQVVEYVLKSWR